MELLKLLSANEVVAQVINFLILFFLLRMFVWKKFLGVLDQRKEKIADDFARIESERMQMEKAKLGYESKLNTIEHEAKIKIQEMIREGHVQAALIKEGAHKDAAKIMEKAQGDIQIEIQSAKQALKEEIVNLVIDATGRVIEERLTPEGDRKIVEKFLEDIDRMP